MPAVLPENAWGRIPVWIVRPGETGRIPNIKDFLRFANGVRLEVVEQSIEITEVNARSPGAANTLYYTISSSVANDKIVYVVLHAIREVPTADGGTKEEVAPVTVWFRIITGTGGDGTGVGRAGYDAAVETRSVTNGFDVRFGSGDPSMRSWTQWFELRDGADGVGTPGESARVESVADTQVGHATGAILSFYTGTTRTGMQTIYGGAHGSPGDDGQSVEIADPTGVIAATDDRAAGYRASFRIGSAASGNVVTTITAEGGLHGDDGQSVERANPTGVIAATDDRAAGYQASFRIGPAASGNVITTIRADGGLHGDDGDDGNSVEIANPTGAIAATATRAAGYRASFRIVGSTGGVTTIRAEGGLHGSDGVGTPGQSVQSVNPTGTIPATQTRAAGYRASFRIGSTGSITTITAQGGLHGSDGVGTPGQSVQSVNPTGTIPATQTRAAGYRASFRIGSTGSITTITAQGGLHGSDGVGTAGDSARVTSVAWNPPDRTFATGATLTFYSGTDSTGTQNIYGGRKGENVRLSTPTRAIPATQTRAAGYEATFQVEGSTGSKVTMIAQGGLHGDDGVGTPGDSVVITNSRIFSPSPSTRAAGWKVDYTVGGVAQQTITAWGGLHGSKGDPGDPGDDGKTIVIHRRPYSSGGQSGYQVSGTYLPEGSSAPSAPFSPFLLLDGEDGADGSEITDEELATKLNRIMDVSQSSNGTITGIGMDFRYVSGSNNRWRLWIDKQTLKTWLGIS